MIKRSIIYLIYLTNFIGLCLGLIEIVNCSNKSQLTIHCNKSIVESDFMEYIKERQTSSMTSDDLKELLSSWEFRVYSLM